MPITPEVTYQRGGEMERANDFVDAYNSRTAVGQIIYWRKMFVTAQRPKEQLSKEALKFVSRAGRETIPRGYGNPPPTPYAGAERRSAVQNVSPETGDVCKEQLAVYATSEACAAVLMAGSPEEAKDALTKVPEFNGETINTLMREVSFDGTPGRITVATAVDYWRRAINVDADQNSPRYGMSVDKDLIVVMARGKAAFDAFAGVPGDATLRPDADYIWEVAMKLVLATNEQGKWGLGAKGVTKPWMVECARIDSILQGAEHPDASNFVKKMSRLLPVTCEGYLSSVLHPDMIVGKDIKQFVQMATATPNTDLDTPSLFATDFTDPDLKTLGDYYGGAAAGVYEGLVKSKFLAEFVKNPAIEMAKLTKGKPSGFLGKMKPEARNRLVSKLIEITARWHYDPTSRFDRRSPAESERKLDEKGYRIGTLSNLGELKKFIKEFESLFDAGVRDKTVDATLVNSSHREDWVTEPLGRAAGTVTALGGSVVGSVAKIVGLGKK